MVPSFLCLLCTFKRVLLVYFITYGAIFLFFFHNFTVCYLHLLLSIITRAWFTNTSKRFIMLSIMLQYEMLYKQYILMPTVESCLNSDGSLLYFSVASVCLLVLLLLLLLLPFYSHYTGQPALASIPSYELQDFAGAKFYCPHALADGN